MHKWTFSLLIVMSIVCLPGRTLQSRMLQAKKPCQCFCAFKPGLRDKEAQDTPLIATLTNSKGKTFNICLCAKRDLERLKQNPELIDLITDDAIKSANCCSAQ